MELYRITHTDAGMLVTLADDSMTIEVTVSVSDLLCYSRFQAAVLTKTGRLFRDEGVESARKPGRDWLDLVHVAIERGATK